MTCLLKNSTPVQIREAKEDHDDTEPRHEVGRMNFRDRFETSEKQENKITFEEKLETIEIDQAKTMKTKEKERFVDTLKEFGEVLEDTLPG